MLYSLRWSACVVIIVAHLVDWWRQIYMYQIISSHSTYWVGCNCIKVVLRTTCLAWPTAVYCNVGILSKLL